MANKKNKKPADRIKQARMYERQADELNKEMRPLRRKLDSLINKRNKLLFRAHVIWQKHYEMKREVKVIHDCDTV